MRMVSAGPMVRAFLSSAGSGHKGAKLMTMRTDGTIPQVRRSLVGFQLGPDSRMAIIRDTSFDPETLATMNRALTQVCGALGLTDRGDPLTSYIARSIVATAERGVLDVGALADAVMHQLEDESVIGGQGEGFTPP